VTTTQKDGSRSVTRSDKNGTVSETFDKKGKKITSNTVGRFPEMKVNTSTNTNISTNISSNDDSDEEDLYAKYEDIKEEIMDLRQEIKECDCTTNKDFRKKLINRLEALNATLRKGNSMREMEKIESEYDLIHQTWENGECADNNSDNNGNIGYNNTLSYKNSKNTGNGASVGYSYGTGNSYSDAEQARKDAETARKDSETARKDSERASKYTSKKPDLMQLFFRNLVARGLIAVNVRSRVEFDNSHLRINGKVMDNATFNSIKNEFESHLSKKKPYSIAFSGILSNVTSTGLDISGSLTTSISE
jgi:hypothetical protein